MPRRRRGLSGWSLWLCLGGLALCGARGVAGHEVRPAYLELREIEPDVWSVLFKVPRRGSLRLPVEPALPARCGEVSGRQTSRRAGALIERWTVRCEPGVLAGEGLAVRGLDTTLTDVLVRMEALDGRSLTARLTPEAPVWAATEEASGTGVAATYLTLGVEHILGGVDHLLFVLALLMLVEGWRLVVATVTAFTVAHSVTLALATLGVMRIPGAPVEAVIALSILFLATEIVHGRQGRPGLTARAPWIVAFTFGLLHGFGFAGALAEVGLPERAIPQALLFFNLGVEAGQIAFVAVVLAATALYRALRLPWPAWAWRLPAYGIGIVAAYWLIERVASF